MSDNTQQIVEEVKNELAEERFIGDKVLVSRRELVAVAAGSATVAGLLGSEAGTASAQSSGTGRLGDPTPLEYVGANAVDTESASITEWGEVADYTIYQRSGTVYARDGNGVEQFSGSDVGAVVKSAYDDLARGLVFIAPGRYNPWDTTVTVDSDKKGILGHPRLTEVVVGANIGSSGYLIDVDNGDGTSVTAEHVVGGFKVQSGGNPAQAAVRVTNSQEGYFPDISVGCYGDITHAVELDDSRNSVYRCRFPGLRVDSPAGSGIGFTAANGKVNRNRFSGFIDGGGETATALDVPSGADTNVFMFLNVEAGGDSAAGNPAISDAGTGTRWIATGNEGGNGMVLTGTGTQLLGHNHPGGLDMSGASAVSGFTVQKGLVPAEPRDLSTVSPSRIGHVAVDDGTNTTSGNPELALGYDSTGDGSADSWFTMQGDSI